MPKSSAFHSTATSRALGTASLRSAKRLADSSVATSETPVMLPPGWARPATKPGEAGGDRVPGEGHHDRGFACPLLRGQRCRIAARDNDVGVTGNQLVDELG